jgi:oligosaccharide repeat unit polymerase
MSLDGVIYLLVGLILVNYWLSRSVLYPPFLFCSIWLLDLTIYRFSPGEFDALHSNTLALLGMGAVFFTLGGLLGMLFPKALITARFVLTRFPPRNNLAKPAVILFLACGIPLLLSNLLTLASQGTGNTIFQQARNAGVAGAGGGQLAGGNPLGTYFILWSLYAAPLFLIEERDKKFWVMTTIALLASLLSTGRLPFLMLISSLTCVELLKTNRHTFWSALKFARIPILLFMCLFFGLLFLIKDTSIFEGGIGAIALLFLVSYLIGPTGALDYLMQHPQDYAGQPHHTFKFFLGIFTQLHLISYVQPPKDDFVPLIVPTNVFTFYRYYLTDFGFYGTLIVIAIIGLLQTLLYRKARTGSMLGMYFFAITLYAVLLAPFSDEFSSFGAYIDSLAFAGIYIVLRSLPVRVLPRLDLRYGTPGSDPIAQPHR